MTRDNRHDADEIVGRITTRGAWDRRYKVRRDLDISDDWQGVRETLASLFVLGLLFLALFLWLAIGAAAR